MGTTQSCLLVATILGKDGSVGYYVGTPGSEMPTNQMGPAVLGRLRGAAYRLANKITITIPDDIRINNGIRCKTMKGAKPSVLEA